MLTENVPFGMFGISSGLYLRPWFMSWGLLSMFACSWAGAAIAENIYQGLGL